MEEKALTAMNERDAAIAVLMGVREQIVRDLATLTKDAEEQVKVIDGQIARLRQERT